MTKYLNKTKIEWCEATWNPVTGCLHTCEYCYARKLATNKFYAKAFPHGFEPHFYPERLDAPLKHKKPSRIFCGSMTDLFGEWVKGEWLEQIFDVILNTPQHTYYILTKNPRGIRKLYENNYLGGGDFLLNLYIGVSIDMLTPARQGMIDELKYQWPGKKFVSFEPILYCEKYYTPRLEGLDWVIMGARTNPGLWVNVDVVERIKREAKRHNTPVFMKNNLHPYVMQVYDPLIQEIPK